MEKHGKFLFFRVFRVLPWLIPCVLLQRVLKRLMPFSHRSEQKIGCYTVHEHEHEHEREPLTVVRSMREIMEQKIEEKITQRADEITLAGGTDLTVAVCAWTADTMVVVLEWFNGDEPQREIIGSIPLVDPPQHAPREIRLGSFVAVGANSLSSAFKAVQQAQICNQPIWHGTVDGQPVTVRQQPL